MADSFINFINQASKNQFRTTNLFQLEISTGYSDIDDALQHIEMYGEGFQIPDRTTNYTQVQFKGYPIQVPTTMTMTQEHTMNIRCDSEGTIHRAFLAWQAKTVDPAITAGSIFAGDRRVNTAGVIRVKLLSSEDNETVSETYKMIGVKVAKVGGVSVSNTDAAVSTFEVSFTSQYWEIEEGSISKGAFPAQV